MTTPARKYDHAEIIRLHRAGLSVRQIAARYANDEGEHPAPSRVHRIIEKWREEQAPRVEAEKLAAAKADKPRKPEPKTIVIGHETRMPGGPPALGRIRCVLTTDGLGGNPGMTDFLNEKDRWAAEIERRRATRPPDTPDWLLELGDSDYLREIDPDAWRRQEARRKQVLADERERKAEEQRIREAEESARRDRELWARDVADGR